jgi:hypothetical protein
MDPRHVTDASGGIVGNVLFRRFHFDMYSPMVVSWLESIVA